jgi:ATP-dependent DNA helicase RecG
MFGKHPQKTMPHSAVRMTFPDGSWKRLTGNLPGLIEDVERELANRLAAISRKKGFRRIDRFEYPLDALREGVVNALVHRNFAIKSEVFIELFAQGVVIKNPGSFPPGTTPEDPHPVPRNPALYELLFLTGFVERQGRGLDLIRESCEKHGLIGHEYELSSNFTTLRFYKKTEDLTMDMQELLRELDEGELTSSDIAKRFRISRVTAVRRMNRLVEKGYAERIGKGPSTRYRTRR